MDEHLVAVGQRIRLQMPVGLTQRGLAQRAGMKPDALSRALNGQRGFSSPELARIADELGSDLYWLVTGKRDPRQVRVAARHVWDSGRGVRANPGRVHDEKYLEQVIDAYKAAFPGGPPSSMSLPDSPESLRNLLGNEFVWRFSAAVEAQLGIDVVRLPKLSTDYSLTIGARSVIILATTPNWFRSNWSLAHELAHVALGHHNGDQHPGESAEAPADDFAASLLLPENLIKKQDWLALDAQGVAQFLWETGVSTIALKNRLATLKLQPSDSVVAALRQTTPVAVRARATDETESFAVRREMILRQQAASARAVPSTLIDALEQRVSAGAISPEHLANALGVSVDEIDFPEPDDDQELARAAEQGMDNRPSHSDLAGWLAANRRATS